MFDLVAYLGPALRFRLYPLLTTCALCFVLTSQAYAQDLLGSQWIYSPISQSNSVAFSPDTTLVAVAGKSGIQVINRLFLGLTSSVQTSITAPLAIEFSPDGKTLLIGGTSPSATQVIVELWNLSSLQLTARITTGAAANLANAFAFSSKADKFAVSTGGQTPAIELWDVPSQALIADLPTKATQVSSLAFSPDSSLIGDGAVITSVQPSSQMGIVELWDASTGSLTKSFSTPSALPGVTAVTFSPDSKAVASGISTNSTGSITTNLIQIWNISTGSLARNLTSATNEPITSVAYTPDGSLIINSGQIYTPTSLTSRGVLEIWNAASGAKVGSLQPPATIEVVTKFAISSDNATIAAVGIQTIASQVVTSTEMELWDIPTQSVTSTFNLGVFQQPGSTANNATPIALSGDNSRLATAGYFYNPLQNTYSSSISIWTTSTGTLLSSLASNALNGINSLAFSPDGATFADAGITGRSTGGLTGVLEIWNSVTGTLTGKPNTSANILNAVAFSPDGALLADAGQSFQSGITTSIVELWNASSWAKLDTLESAATSELTCLAFSPDSSIIADAGIALATNSRPMLGVVELWSRQTGTLLASLPTSANATLSSIGFSPDGKLIGVGGASMSNGKSFQPVAEIWIVASHQLIATLPIALGPTTVNSVAFSPDGTVIFISTDSGVQTFSAQTFELLNEFSILPNFANPSLSGPVGILLVAPNGSLLAAASPANSLMSWFGVFPNPSFASNPPVQNLTVDPGSVRGGTPAIGVVTLSAPAPKGGAIVQLSSNSAAVLVPPTVAVTAGSASASFQVTTRAVDTSRAATIIAGTGTNSRSFTETITPAEISGITVNPSSVQGGLPTSGTITLNGPAGPNGTIVTLSSNNLAVSVPTSITIPAGYSFATFTASTTPMVTPANVTLTASLNGITFSTTITVTPITLISLSVTPQSIPGGIKASGIVSVNGPAPGSGMVVKLSSNSSYLTIPQSITVLPGQTSASFTLTTAPTSTQKSATITAQSGPVSLSTKIQVVPASLASITVNRPSVLGGTTAMGTVALNGIVASGGFIVKVASNSSYASVPRSVTIPAGKASASFTVNTKPTSSSINVAISASSAGVTETTTLTIDQPTLASITASPSSLTGGASTVGTVKLGSVAPSAGITVSLTGFQGIVSLPKSITVGSGRTSATFVIKTTPVAKSTLAQISATLGSAIQSTTLTLDPPTLKSLVLKPASVIGGVPTIGTVNIGSPAPVGGLAISLVGSSDVVSVPLTVTIPPGKRSATFTVTTQHVNAKQQVTITAKLGETSKSAVLEVSQP